MSYDCNWYLLSDSHGFYSDMQFQGGILYVEHYLYMAHANDVENVCFALLFLLAIGSTI